MMILFDKIPSPSPYLEIDGDFVDILTQKRLLLATPVYPICILVEFYAVMILMKWLLKI